MKRLLLSGVAGFVGSHIAEQVLAQTDWEVVGLASYRHRGDSQRLAALTSPRLQLYYCDLRGPISPVLSQELGRIDYVIHAAALAHVDRSLVDPVGTMENNLSASLHMLELARRLQPEAFLLLSTNEVFGPQLAPDLLHQEWDALVPGSPYAASKAASESAAIAYWRSYGLPLIIATTQNLFGQRQPAEKLIPTVIRKVLAGQPVGIQPGAHYWLHASSLAAGLLFLLERGSPVGPAQASRPERFNVRGPSQLSNLALAELVAQTLGLPLTTWQLNSNQPGHDAGYGLDDAKLAALGWAPPLDLETSLTATVRWYQANPYWL